MEEIREKTSEELRMLLKRNYDVSETEVAKMRERAKRVETSGGGESGVEGEG
jgi:hypothetical protein